MGHLLIPEEISHWEIGHGKYVEDENSTITLASFGRPKEVNIIDGILIEVCMYEYAFIYYK